MQFIAENVTRIYLGRDDVCRCGCHGEYVERGEPKFDMRLRRFAKKLEGYEPGKDDVGDNYLNVSYGNDRAMTAYFD